MGGFDPSYFPFDDYEFGVRLLAAGAALAFCPAARGKHVDEAVLVRSMKRIETEGKLCVRMARAYPELGGVLPHAYLASSGAILMRAAAELARRQPRMATWISLRMARAAAVAERLQIYTLWFLAAGIAMTLRYWIGVWQEAQGWDEVRLLEGRAGVRPSGEVVTVELADGLRVAATRLDACGSAGVAVTWRGMRLGELLPAPGAEPLRGRHLRAWVEGEGAIAVARVLDGQGKAASSQVSIQV